MRESVYKNYGEAKVLRVGSRMVAPKEKRIQWMEEQTGGAI